MASTQSGISVSPGIPGYAATRYRQLGLPSRSLYLAILLHNYLHDPPQTLPVVENPARVVKVRVALSIPRSLRIAAKKAAARRELSLSRLVESLVTYDAAREEQTLTIVPVRGTTKPSLKLAR